MEDPMKVRTTGWPALIVVAPLVGVLLLLVAMIVPLTAMLMLTPVPPIMS